RVAICDDWNSAGQRLANGDAPSLLIARRDEYAALAEDSPFLLLGHEAGPIHGVADAQPIRKLEPRNSLRTGSYHHQPRSGHTPAHARPRLDGVGHAFRAHHSSDERSARRKLSSDDLWERRNVDTNC